MTYDDVVVVVKWNDFLLADASLILGRFRFTLFRSASDTTKPLFMEARGRLTPLLSETLLSFTVLMSSRETSGNGCRWWRGCRGFSFFTLLLVTGRSETREGGGGGGGGAGGATGGSGITFNSNCSVSKVPVDCWGGGNA